MTEENAKIRRTREAIENKMRAGDYAAARTLIFEAQKAFPGFDHASEMRTVCEILCFSEMEFPGYGIDWYWVLQLFASADLDTIKSKYHKIVSQLNLIKNDFSGTDLALNFAAHAFSVLSDPVKREAFDSKRNTFYNICEDSNSPSSFRPKRIASEVCSQNGDANGTQKRKICDMEARWIMEDSDNLQKARGILDENHVARKRLEKDFYDFEKMRMVELFSVGQIWAAYDEEHMPRRYGRIYKIEPQKHQFYLTWFKGCPQLPHEKKWQDAGFPIACGTFAIELNKITLGGLSMFSHMLSDGKTKEPLEIHPMKGEVWAMYRDWDLDWCSDPGMRKRCVFEMVEVFADYVKDYGVKVACLVRVDGLNSVFQRYSERRNEVFHQIPSDKLLMFSHKVPSYRFVGGERDGISSGMLELDPLAVPDNLVQDVALMDSTSQSNEERYCNDESTVTIDNWGSSLRSRSQKVKWRPKDFVEDQVWAIYEGPDAMPRTYVRINSVVSPTKVSVTSLEPHPMLDQEIHWVEEDLPIVCGIFRASRATVNLDMSKFSHQVQCDRSFKGSYYRIFPRKGEVWAMYSNWNINWQSCALNSCQYRVVEILSDFSEENGINICCLVEVGGCLTFFQRQLHDGFNLTKQLSRFELLSFSHRIPAFVVTGVKNPDIPKGSLHLEPDALPPKFIS